MSLLDLVNAAADARLQEVYAKARADALKAAAIGEAERQRAARVPVRELISDQGLGALRLDGSNLPAVPLVNDTDATTSWLAQVAPDLIRAVLTVPIDAVEDAISALGFAGIGDVAARAEFRDPDAAARWISDHCKIQADPDVPGAWNVLYIDADGHTTPVPGVSAMRPTPTWKIIADKDLQADNRARAQSEADELVDQLRRADAAALASTVAEKRDEIRRTVPDVAAALGDRPDTAADARVERCPHGTPLDAPHCQGCDDVRDGIVDVQDEGNGQVSVDLADGRVEVRDAARTEFGFGFHSGDDDFPPEVVAATGPDVSPADLAEDLADAADEDGYDGPMPGAEGQDREGYTDTQDRDSYVPGPIARGPAERVAALGRGVDAALAKRAEYAARRRAELAVLCEERGLPNVGRKDELTNRLLTADGLLAPDPEPAARA